MHFSLFRLYSLLKCINVACWMIPAIYRAYMYKRSSFQQKIVSSENNYPHKTVAKVNYMPQIRAVSAQIKCEVKMTIKTIRSTMAETQTSDHSTTWGYFAGYLCFVSVCCGFPSKIQNIIWTIAFHISQKFIYLWRKNVRWSTSHPPCYDAVMAVPHGVFDLVWWPVKSDTSHWLRSCSASFGLKMPSIFQRK